MNFSLSDFFISCIYRVFEELLENHHVLGTNRSCIYRVLVFRHRVLFDLLQMIVYFENIERYAPVPIRWPPVHRDPIPGMVGRLQDDQAGVFSFLHGGLQLSPRD